MRTLTYLKESFQKSSRVRKLFLIFLIVAFVGFCGFFGYLVGSKKFPFKQESFSPSSNLISGKPVEPVNFPNPINGLLYKKSEAETWANRLPIAVMIENSTEARPQTGLSKAEVVYEALAEGGITRFMAVFLQNETNLGPIRSARPYYLDWAMEYGAGYAHYGGSPVAENKVKNLGDKNIDGLFIGDSIFHRVPKPGVISEHTVYSSTAELRQLETSRGVKKDTNITSWQFLDKEEAKEKRPTSFSLKLNFLKAFGYDVEWRYKPETNSYLRFNGGSPAIDALDNSQIEKKTIVVQTVSYSYDPSGHGRLFMDTVGTGALKVFQNGTVTDGTWKKDSSADRTKLLDKTGQEIKLVRGPIWVDIVPPESAITY